MTKDAKNLVADDQGETDLGDFQYVLFNLVALAFFIGSVIQEPRQGFPDLPTLLVGLALTSAATYTAKQAVPTAPGPQLTTLFPAPVTTASKPIVDLFGRNLVSGGRAPMVSLDGTGVRRVDVMKGASGAGDHLKFRLPPGTTKRDYKVRVMTADGAEAKTATGGDYLTLTVAVDIPATGGRGGGAGRATAEQRPDGPSRARPRANR